MKLFSIKKLVLVVMLLNTTPAFSAPSFQDAFSPQQGATELVVKTITEANKSIRLAAYSFTSKPIAEALVRAHTRGIDVKVVLDKSQDKERYSSLTFLKNQGIPVRVNYKYAIMHNKFMIVDNNKLQIGSFNYTKAAEERNAENVLVINEAGKVAQDYASQWQKLWDESEAR